MNPATRRFFLLVNLAGVAAGVAIGAWLFVAVTR